MNRFDSNRRPLHALVTALALTALSGAAQAALTVYTTPASFTVGSIVPFTDTFNDLPLDFTASPLSRMDGPYGYTVGTGSGGLYGAGSAADVWLSTDLSGTDITFSGFTGGVRGLGAQFFGSDLTGAFLAGQNITLRATDSSGASASFLLTNATQTSFVGFVSTNAYLTSVTASIASVGAWNTVNNLVLTSAVGPVPEPGSSALLLAGLAAVGVLARRRRLRR